MILLSKGGFNEEETFKAYNINNVIKGDSSNFEEMISKINPDSKEKYLIQIPSTKGLTIDMIEKLPPNTDVRVIGGLTEEYAKSTAYNWDNLRENATYSKSELIDILKKIEEIEKGIDPNWNDYEKALYLYEYLKYDITYRTTESKGNDGKPLDIRGNTNRTRTWDTLIGLTNQLSTCSGFAHIYQELCTRQGIECDKIGGKYLLNGEGSHAWNIITINGQNFLVDTIWDAQDYEKGIDHVTAFGNADSNKYIALCSKDKQQNLSKINPDWIKMAHEKVAKNIPKEHLHQEKVERFIKMREEDRIRMKQLRGEQLNNNIIENDTINNGLSR